MRDPSILVVDDNAQMRLVLKLQLQRLNLTCEQAHDGLQALSLVEQNFYHLIFMDLGMPVMDGFTCTARVRELQERASRRSKIIAITGQSDARECKSRGFDAFLQKPVMIADIEKLLTNSVVGLTV
jgi:two-component system sensor histidine kinase/response regulator